MFTYVFNDLLEIFYWKSGVSFCPTAEPVGFVSTQEFNLLLALKHLFVVFVTRALFTHQVNTVGLNYQQTTASQNSGN